MGLMNCFKSLLYLFNVFFIIAGLTLIGIGIWTAVAKIYVSFVIGDTLFSAASYLLIGVGIVTVSVCIVGICGLMKENPRWLMAYLGLLIFCCLLLITAAVLAIAFKGEVESVMADNMRQSLIEGYGNDREITDAWDQLQKELKCCAISQTVITTKSQYTAQVAYLDKTYPTASELRLEDSWPIYKRTDFFRRQLQVDAQERAYVPISCCVYDETLNDVLNQKTCQTFPNGPPANYEMQLTNDYLYYAGCYQKAKEFVLDQSDIIIALGFVFGFIMIAGMVLTFLLMRWFSSEEYHVSKRRREPDNL